MSYGLNFLKGWLHRAVYVGSLKRVTKGDTRSLDRSSYDVPC